MFLQACCQRKSSVVNHDKPSAISRRGDWFYTISYNRSAVRPTLLKRYQNPDKILSIIPNPNPNKSHVLLSIWSIHEVIILFLSQINQGVSPKRRESSTILENIVDQGPLTHGPAPLSSHVPASTGLLPTLLSAPVKEIKQVAETMSQV